MQPCGNHAFPYTPNLHELCLDHGMTHYTLSNAAAPLKIILQRKYSRYRHPPNTCVFLIIPDADEKNVYLENHYWQDCFILGMIL